MGNAKVKVRPDSRAGRVIVFMLDRCEVPRMPNLDSGKMTFGGAWDDRRDYRSRLRPGMGVVDAESLVSLAADSWGLDARVHDAPEVRRYLSLLGRNEGWLHDTIYEDAVVLYSTAEARGRWMDATDGKHDFPSWCPPRWRLSDGTLAGEPPLGKILARGT
ncbi:hypothetical protein NHN26_06505 [Rhodovulum tesquicola]|uniref:hypothetical protein n=1 Tax=Rhodovulum tesquicola TaxID=540254 RepID=UPI00209817FF|nr:hypothetical protein [Rhodovulum tesquicola]MCO8144873.1 hypothetical protein [Rhodovulum tesquicola]